MNQTTEEKLAAISRAGGRNTVEVGNNNFDNTGSLTTQETNRYQELLKNPRTENMSLEEFSEIRKKENIPTPLDLQLQNVKKVGQEVGNVITTFPDYFTKSGEYATSERLKDIPEIPLSGNLPNTTFGEQAHINSRLLSAKPKVRRDILQAALPDAKFSVIDGSEVMTLDGQQYLTNKPGISPQDLATTFSQILQYIPGARYAKNGATVITRTLKRFIADVGTDLAQTGVTTLLGNEQGFDPRTALVNAANSGVVSLGTEMFKPVREPGVTDVRSFDYDNVEEAAEITKATGVDLSRAQQVGTNRMLEDSTVLSMLPGKAEDISQKFFGKQNTQIKAAVEEFQQLIGTPENLETGSENFRNASVQAIKNLKQQRTNAASPLFQTAMRTSDGIVLDIENDLGVKVEYEIGKDILDPSTGLSTGKNQLTQKLRRFLLQDTNEKTGEIIETSIDAQSPSGNKIRQVLRSINRAGNNLQELDAVKDQLNAMLEKNATTSVDKKTSRHLTKIKNKLIQTLENQSSDYKQGMDIYRNMSPKIEDLENSLVGKVSKIPDVDLKRISNMIFDASETNPKIIQDVKKIIDKTDPEAFSQLLYVELQRRIGKVKIPDGNELKVNTPYLYEKAIFGNNTAQRELIFSSLTGEMRKNARFLYAAMKKAQGGRPSGSQTSTRAPRVAKIQSAGVEGKISQLLTNIFSGKTSAITAGTAAETLENNAANFAEKMFDPKYAEEMTTIREVFTKGDETKSYEMLFDLLNTTEGFVVRETFTDQEAIR
tara:strand:- start:12 stop:2324 length:2313 start_codon:yes stop_codon:yes gene_type:complete